jgi:hypothetical protein
MAKKKKTPIEKAIAREKAIGFKQRVQPKFTPKDIKATQFQLSQNQMILNGMFGGGVGQRVLGDVRPRINKTLQGGDDPFGLIKNRDGGYTASLMLPRGRRVGRIQ